MCIPERATWQSSLRGLPGLRSPRMVRLVIVFSGSSSSLPPPGSTPARPQWAGLGPGPGWGRQGPAGGRGRGTTSEGPPGDLSSGEGWCLGPSRGDSPPDDPNREGGRTGSGRGGSRGGSPLGGLQAGGRSSSRTDSGRGTGGGRGRSSGRDPSGHRSRSSTPGRSPILRDITDLSELEEVVERHVEVWAAEWRIADLQAAFNQLGKICSTPSDEDSRPNAAQPHTSRLAEPAIRVMMKLESAYLRIAHKLPTARSCVTPLWACARLGYWDGGLAEALLKRLGQDEGALLQGATAESHAKLWWSVSRAPSDHLKASAVELLRRSATCLRRMTVKDLVPQDCSNVLLACARLKFDDPSLVNHLTACLADTCGAGNTQALANSLYALAVLDCGDTPAIQRLWTEVRQRLQRSPGDFKPQDLSNLLWALPALQPAGWEEYAGALAAECRRRRFTGFNAQDFSNSVWALAEMGWTEAQDWFKEAAEAATRPGAMAGATAQAWSNLLYGLAVVRHRPHEGLLRAMVGPGVGPLGAGGRLKTGCLETLRTGATSQNCSNLLWSLAVLGLYEQRMLGDVRQLVDVLAGRLGELLQGDPKKLTEQDLANSLWALAAMGAEVLSRHSGLVEGLLREAARHWEAGAADRQRGGTGPFNEEHVTQLWQVQQELLDAGSGGGGDLGLRHILQGALLAAAEDGRCNPGSKASWLQRQVVDSLQQLIKRPMEGGARLGSGDVILSVESELLVAGVCGPVDVVVELEGGRRVAVEVDGPVHFLANHPHTHTKTGPTRLRDRQLERALGPGNVAGVPYWEWNAQKSVRTREGYLCGLLGLQVPRCRSGGEADR